MADTRTRQPAARPGDLSDPPGYARWAPWVTFPLALLGLALATYLTYAHYGDPKVLICSDTGTVNCLKVTTSSQSEIFGVVPVALAGALYFLVMVALVSPPAWRLRTPWAGRLRIAAAVAGMGMVAYLVFVEAVQLHALCLYCTGVHVITFLLLVAILAAELLRPLPDLELEPAPSRRPATR